MRGCSSWAPRSLCGAALVLQVALLATGCHGPLSEIVVQVDSDLPLDAVRVLAERGSESERARADLGPTERPLPRSVTIVDRSGSGLPVELTVTGEQDGADLVRQRLRVRFVEGETVVVRVELLAACIDGTVVCAEDERCTAAGCRPLDVPTCELSSTCDAGVGDGGAMDARVPREDAGSLDAFVPPLDDAGPEIDANVDAGPDGADVGVGVDAGPDGGADAGVGVDAGPDGGVDGGPDAGVDAGPPMCTTGCVTCGGSCVDVRWDPDHCETCGTVCPGAEVCNLGMCRTCNQTVCGERCVNTSSDPDHCGGCFRPCGDAQVCTSDLCVAALPGQRCGNPHEIGGAGTFAMGEASLELTSYKDLPFYPVCLGRDTLNVSTAIVWTAPMAGTVRFRLDVGGVTGRPVIEEFPADDTRCGCSVPGQCAVGPSTGAVTLERAVASGERVRLVLGVTNPRDATLTVSYL